MEVEKNTFFAKMWNNLERYYNLPCLGHNVHYISFQVNGLFLPFSEAKSLDRIKITESCLEFDRKIKLRFVGFIRFVSFNFGHVQLLRFVVVMVRSYSFRHLDLVKWITLLFPAISVIFLHLNLPHLKKYTTFNVECFEILYFT